MSEQIKKIKLLTSVDGEVALKIEDSVKQIKGVLDAKIDLENSILTYALDMWASDYDSMVSIMNLLGDDYGLDSEPLFEESEEVEEDEYIYTPNEEESCEGEEELVEDEKQNKRKEVLYKFIEVGLSAICLIVGFILASIPKTSDAAPYLYTIAFAVVSYEFIFSTIASIFKKQFNFTNIALLLAILLSLVLAIPLGSAIVMVVYACVSILYELFKLDFIEKHGEEFSFDLKADKKLNKVNGIILAAIFTLGLLVSFILPIFLGDYGDNLVECAKRAVTILLIFAITPSIFSLPLSYALTYKYALKNDIKINNESAYTGLKNAKKVAYLGQCVFVENESLKENAVGSVLELYDAGILETVLLSSKTKESTSKLRKELSITKSVSMLDDTAKNSEVLALKNSGGVIAVGSLKTDANLTVTLSGSQDFDVNVLDCNLKKVPLTVKLLKRFNAINKQNIVVSLIAKVALSVLCGFGVFTSIEFAVVPMLLVGVLLVLNAIRNKVEII